MNSLLVKESNIIYLVLSTAVDKYYNLDNNLIKRLRAELSFIILGEKEVQKLFLFRNLCFHETDDGDWFIAAVGCLRWFEVLDNLIKGSIRELALLGIQRL